MFDMVFIKLDIDFFDVNMINIGNKVFYYVK